MNNFMSIFGQIQNNPQMLNQFKNNASQMLGNLQGVNMQDPNSILQYGLNTGNIKQENYNQVISFLRQFGYKG